MATTIHIESGLMATTPARPLSVQILRVLQNCDTFIDKVQDMFLTLQLFRKKQSFDHHLNLLLEVNEHEAQCGPSTNSHNTNTRVSGAIAGVKSNEHQYFFDRKKEEVVANR